MEGVEYEAEEMKSALEYVTEWIKDSDANSDAFGMWCTVACMMSNGLCDTCAVNDSFSRYGQCSDAECFNYRTPQTIANIDLWKKLNVAPGAKYLIQ